MAAEVTVVIPTKNRRELLLRTLRSVLGQSMSDLVVVVVDDGGSDGTADAIRELGDERVRVLRHQESRGVSAARNAGLAAAVTSWVAFVDDDDLWSPSKLRAQLHALRALPGSAWSFTGAANIDDLCRVLFWSVPPAADGLAASLLGLNAIPGGGSGVLVSTALAREVGGFDESLSNLADWDFYIRVGLRARAAPVSRPLVGYFIHQQGMAHNFARSEVEYRYMEAKYRVERERHGVELDRDTWRYYMGTMAFKAHRRALGTRLHLGLLLRRRRMRSLLVLVGGFAPMDIRPLRAGIARLQAPSGWAAEARAWLAPYMPEHASSAEARRRRGTI